MIKRKLILVFVLVCIAIITACSNSGRKVEAKDTYLPFEVYEYVDNKGCEYLVVHDSVGASSATAITPKIIQSKGLSCSN